MKLNLRNLLSAAIIAASTCAYAAVDNLYITGSFTDPSWDVENPAQFTKAEDGSFSYLAPAAGCTCKISSAKGAWSSFDAAAKAANPTLGGEAVALASSTENITVPISANGVTIKIDADFTTIQFLGEAPTSYVAPEIYIMGSSYGNWAATDTYKFTLSSSENNIFVYTLTVESLSGEFKIADAAWSTVNFGGATITKEDTYTLIKGGANIKVSETVSNATLTVTYDPANDTCSLKVEGTWPSTPTTLYLYGDFNDWKTTNPFTFVEKKDNGDKVYEIEVSAISGEFKIADAAWSSYNLGTAEATTLTTTDTSLNVINANNSQNIALPEGYTATGKITLTYSGLDDGNATLALDLTYTASSGVDNIAIDAQAPAQYFNMQGVRVANPTPGIYIVRRGNTVTKTIIR